MPESTQIATKATRWQRLRGFLAPAAILLIAGGIVAVIAGDWNSWTSDRTAQETDDAYVRADLTPLSTKVAGLVAQVPVSDYQTVKAGDLLVQLRNDDFRAQVQQAEAAVGSGEASLINNQRQKDLQDARIVQAQDGIQSSEADVAAAEAGIAAAKSAIASAQSGIEGTKAEVQRTLLERKRQDALIATESATRQKLEQVAAEEERYRATLSTNQANVSAAEAQLASRQADLARARAHLASSQSEVEAQRRQRAVLDSQELLLRADLAAKKASLALAQTNLGYTRITAPEDGIVSERKVRTGQLVSPGTQVIALVQNDVWVDANYKETQLRYMKAGDPAEIRVDAVPGVVFRGKLDHLAPASGSQFALLPPDNATGNFTKVVQRVPVRIVLDRNQPDLEKLRPGLSVVASVRTNVTGH